jgi:hypothetical protein
VRALVLCRSRDTRAHPLTMDVRKPLLPVAGRPVLEHLIEVYAGQGIIDVMLVASFRFDAMSEFASTPVMDGAVEVVDTGLEINASFAFDNRAWLDHQGEDLQRSVLPSIGEEDEALLAHRHPGYWTSKDTHAGQQALDAVATVGTPPRSRSDG